MRTDAEIEQLLKQSRLATTVEQDERTLADALAALDEATADGPSSSPPAATETAAASGRQRVAPPLRTSARSLRRHRRAAIAAACVLVLVIVLPFALRRGGVENSGGGDEVAGRAEPSENAEPATVEAGERSRAPEEWALAAAPKPKTFGAEARGRGSHAFGTRTAAGLARAVPLRETAAPPAKPPPGPAGPVPAPPGKSRLPAKGLVGYWAGEGNAWDSAGKNHGAPAGDVTFVKGKTGRCFKLAGRGAHIRVNNAPALQITGDQTVAMWLRPETIQKHMNPFHKAYGGEFSVLLREGGMLRYAFGTSGRNERSYAALVARDAVEMLKARKWVHFAAVRDVKAKRVRLYINGRKARNIYGVIYILGAAKGKPYDGDITILPKAVASRYPAYIGRGNNECFEGLIDEVAIWSRALSEAEIARVAGIGPGVPHLDRAPNADRLLATGGEKLLGDILAGQFIVTTSFGKVTVPAGHVVGFTAGGAQPTSGPAAERARPSLVLTDGQVLVGKLTGEAVPIKLPDGSTLRVRPERIREFAYRVSDSRPASPKLSGTMVSLAGGERLILAGSGPELQLLTAHGKVDLPAPGLRFVETTDRAEAPHRVCFLNGSELSGMLRPEQLVLKLRLGAQTTVRRDAVRRIDRFAKPVEPAGPCAVELRNGDRLFGTMVDKRLTLQTADGKVTIRTTDLWAMAFDAAGGGDVQARMWGGGVVRGRLVESAVALAVVPAGPTVRVKAAQIAALARLSADPPQEVAKKVAALIARLGAQAYRDREAATQALRNMGPSILPLLRPSRTHPDPEIRQRVEQILKGFGVRS